MSKSYFNTLGLFDSPLKDKEHKASGQNELILNFFRDHKYATYNPFEIQTNCDLMDTPITSIRRAMTTLTKQGKLEKTNIKRVGEYGELNFTWRYKSE